jgi:hypothetical protein
VVPPASVAAAWLPCPHLVAQDENRTLAERLLAVGAAAYTCQCAGVPIQELLQTLTGECAMVKYPQMTQNQRRTALELGTRTSGEKVAIVMGRMCYTIANFGISSLSA